MKPDIVSRLLALILYLETATLVAADTTTSTVTASYTYEFWDISKMRQLLQILMMPEVIHQPPPPPEASPLYFFKSLYENDPQLRILNPVKQTNKCVGRKKTCNSALKKCIPSVTFFKKLLENLLHQNEGENKEE